MSLYWLRICRDLTSRYFPRVISAVSTSRSLQLCFKDAITALPAGLSGEKAIRA